ncbi:MAG: hypothetical protein GY833_22450 [Aestuariibacter sp.]|nr:hypothetical protein [Aestuariibacter sp.]|tara:strand:+ start:265502 stop:266260 length:759 start_codon:yes stop_codon:yes gene_type:complete
MIRSNHVLRQLYHKAKDGLEAITNPIQELERQLEDGQTLDGHAAMNLSNDPEYLKGLAQQVLDQLDNIVSNYHDRKLVVFLDMDDVVCTQESEIAHGGAHYVEPTAIGLLRELTNRGNICFVISSVWRLGNSYLTMRRILQTCGLGSNILFRDRNANEGDPNIAWKTPDTSRGIRGQHIQDWLDLYGDQIEQYAIIDDCCDMLESQMGNFVHVDSATGFNRRNFEEVLHIFGLLNGDLRPAFQPKGVAANVK